MDAARFSFGDFVFDSRRDLLSERGVPVNMGRRALALLRMLLSARGNVVDKSALIDGAWPSLFVEESNLTVQIAALRRRLGSTPDGGAWIDTFPRVGYRFAGAFSSDEDAQAAPPVPAARPAPAPLPIRSLDERTYELYVRARSLMLQSPGGNSQARAFLLHVLQRDPLFAAAHACLGIVCFGDAIYFGRDVAVNRSAGAVHVQTAVRLNPDDATARWASGFVHLYSREVDEAQRDWESALSFVPDQPEILAKLGDLHVQAGDPERGVELAERAVRLNPFALACTYWDLGFAYYAAGRYLQAVEVLRRPEMDRLPSRRILAASLAQLGELDEAREEGRRFLSDSGPFSIAAWADTQLFRRKEDIEHFADGYARAGLPR